MSLTDAAGRADAVPEAAVATAVSRAGRCAGRALAPPLAGAAATAPVLGLATEGAIAVVGANAAELHANRLYVIVLHSKLDTLLYFVIARRRCASGASRLMIHNPLV
jgi:hypothetical protein